MAKPGAKSTRKKITKTVVDGIAHVHASFNNTIVSICDPEGNVISWASAGTVGFKGSRKGTPFAATLVSQAAGNAVMMGAGYFSPLSGYMNVADAMGAAEKMTLSDGSFFPVPVMCLLQDTDAIGDELVAVLGERLVEGDPLRQRR